MAIKTATKIPSPAPQRIPKTGAHTHQCSRNNHIFDCQYSSRCSLESQASAQVRIDEICPACHAIAFGDYGV